MTINENQGDEFCKYIYQELLTVYVKNEKQTKIKDNFQYLGLHSKKDRGYGLWQMSVKFTQCGIRDTCMMLKQKCQVDR